MVRNSKEDYDVMNTLKEDNDAEMNKYIREAAKRPEYADMKESVARSIEELGDYDYLKDDDFENTEKNAAALKSESKKESKPKTKEEVIAEYDNAVAESKPAKYYKGIAFDKNERNAFKEGKAMAVMVSNAENDKEHMEIIAVDPYKRISSRNHYDGYQQLAIYAPGAVTSVQPGQVFDTKLKMAQMTMLDISQMTINNMNVENVYQSTEVRRFPEFIMDDKPTAADKKARDFAMQHAFGMDLNYIEQTHERGNEVTFSVLEPSDSLFDKSFNGNRVIGQSNALVDDLLTTPQAAKFVQEHSKDREAKPYGEMLTDMINDPNTSSANKKLYENKLAAHKAFVEKNGVHIEPGRLDMLANTLNENSVGAVESDKSKTDTQQFGS